jgi:hypothetical protein
MRKDIFRFTLAIVLLVVFALLIYPTPFYYTSYDNTPMKINRVTGKIEVVTSGGWAEVNKK